MMRCLLLCRRNMKLKKEKKTKRVKKVNGTVEISKVEKGIWEGGVGKDANKKNLGSCHRSQGDI